MSTGVDYDLLADYVGGALEGTPDQERVAHLVATSPEWSHAADELTVALLGVRNDLNVLRLSPEPMPDDVAARFERLFDGPTRDPLEARVVTRHHAKPGAGGAKRWRRWAAPAALVAAVLGFLALGRVPGLVTPALNDEAGGTSQFSVEAPAAGPPAPVPTVATWRRYDRNSLTGALAAGAQDAPAPYGSLATDSDGRSSAEKSDPNSPLARLTDRFALQQCLNSVTAVLPGRVNLVEYAYFEGSPALVISITSTNGQWWFVAGENCGQPGADERFRAPLK